MKKQIFRLPVDKPHFKLTIIDGKPYDEIRPFLSDEEKEQVEKLIGADGKVRFWGTVPGLSNSSVFGQMQVGDTVLPCESAKYLAVATIGYKNINPKLARYCWGVKDDGNTWELMYYFSEVTFIKLQGAILHKELGYKEKGYARGLSKISGSTTETFIQKHGSVLEYMHSVGAVKGELEQAA
jgi:hypothetical protein